MPEDPKKEPSSGSAQPRNSNHAYTSWKEIAQHFGREVRTVQRWEKEEGLPVHRHVHLRRASVYAYPEELDAWWRERGAHISEPPAEPAPEQPRTGEETEAASVGAKEGEAPFTKAKLWLAAPVLVVLLMAVAWLRFSNNQPQAEEVPPFPVITLDGSRPNGLLQRVYTGDWNGDGVGDFAVSANAAREIYIYFGGALPHSGMQLPSVASTILTGPTNGGLAVTEVGDFNGDGLADLLVSHLLDEPETYTQTGPSYLVWGRKQWPKAMRLPEDADVVLGTSVRGDLRLGACASSSGARDLNGDGIDDVFLGAPDYGGPERHTAGTIFIFWGRREWPRRMEVRTDADSTIVGSQSGEGLSDPCAVADFNGDGRPDLAVYAGESQLWNLLGGRGKLYIFYGREKWPRKFDARTDFSFRVDGVIPKGFRASFLFADMNGDGREDLVLGWPIMGDKSIPGQLQIWFGGTERRGAVPATGADVAIRSTAPGTGLGAGLASTDLDGDGLADLIFSEFFSGEVYLLYGRHDWKKDARLTDYAPVRLLHGDPTTGYLRMGLSDLDGDGIAELIAASQSYGSAESPGTGRVWIVKPYLPIQVDVRPEKKPNVVLYPDALVVARVPAQAGLPKDAIDPVTLRLGGAKAMSYMIRDFDGDGREEIQAQFEARAMRITPASTSVALTAHTRAGLPMAGADSIVVVDSRSASGRRAVSASGNATR
jgi:hypothetical protein